MKPLLIRLSFLALVFLLTFSFTACGTSVSDEPAETNAPETAAAADVPAAAETTVPAAETDAAQDDLSAVYAAYLREVRRVYDQNASEESEYGEIGRNAENTEFFLYDFDADGIPELMLNHGYKTNTMEEGVSIYTFVPGKGLVHLGNTDPMASFFTDETPGDSEFGLYCFYHDHMAEYVYKIEGETMQETVVQDWREADVSGDLSEYQEVKARVQPYLIVPEDGWYEASDAENIFAGF